MLIMVIQGGNGSARDNVISALTHFKNPRVVTIDVSFIASIERRIETLQQMLHKGWDVMNVVVGANSAQEIEYLRGVGAMFCNVHRHYPQHLLEIPGAIHRDDVLVSTWQYEESDVEVLSPDEAFSECLVRDRARRRKRQEVRHGHEVHCHQ
ncbi:TPA: hypothetical protein ACMDPH_003456 [Vibrio cholerae]|uniref:Uncharacterized protein n=1 Tax=Enterovibrio sp. FF_113 TaxID=1660266 RepID=A0A0H3ZZB2_9GAMM|nr:hypothetical protein [Enterovibrio sp. FF_113]